MDEIILYSTGCPRCKELKIMLDKNGIKYSINQDVQEMETLGFSTVPILKINNEFLNYTQAVKWLMNNKRRDAHEKQ